MLDPTTLPNASPVAPWNAPIRLTISSGELVPKPTMVNPMTIGETPRLAAMSEAPRTSNVPPPISTMMPSATPKNDNMRQY